MLLAFALAALAGAPPAEPVGLARLVRGADAAAVDKALADAGLSARCKDALQRQDPTGLLCRLAVARAIGSTAMATAADVDAGAALAADALAAADFIAAFTPTAPEPGLRRVRLDAHRIACDIAFRTLAALEALPATHPGAEKAKAVLAGTSTSKALPPVGLRDGACACAQRTVDLAVGANADTAETTELQAVLTGQRCLLAGDTLKIAERKDPGKALTGGNDALRTVAAAASPEGRLLELARGRALDLQRCTDKFIAEDQVKDVEKLTSCACGVVKRWALPLKKDEPKASARLPLAGSWVLPITVEGGRLTVCGPAERPGAASPASPAAPTSTPAPPATP